MATVRNQRVDAYIQAGRAQAKELKQHPGVSAVDIASARNTLALLQHSRPKATEQQKALATVVKQLTKALDGAHIDQSARGLGDEHRPQDPTGRHPLPVLGGPTRIFWPPPNKHRAFTPERIDQLRLAVSIQGLEGAKTKPGGFIEAQPLGSQHFEQATLRDDRPVDGALLRVFVKAGQLNGPTDPNKNSEFFIEHEWVNRRTGKAEKSWAGPFDIGLAGHPKARQFQAELRHFAMEAGYHLSRSDGLSLKSIKDELALGVPNGQQTITFGVHGFLDPKDVKATITARINRDGELIPGSAIINKAIDAGVTRPPVVVIEPKPGTHLAQLMVKNGYSFAQKLEMPMLRGNLHGPNTSVTFADIKARKDGGFDVKFDVKRPNGQLHVVVDKKGKFESGFYTLGKVPAKIVARLDEYQEVFDVASKASKPTAISKSHNVDLISVAEGEGGKGFQARLSINDWRTGKPSWQVLVELDQDGKFKSGAIDDRFITPDTGGPSAHDLKNARGLVKAIGPQGVFPNGSALPQAKQPEFKNGHWFAPDGDRLLKVTVSRAFGGAPRPTVTAFVNPKKNDFYLEWDDPMGRTGSHYQGPSKLADGARFEGTRFTEADYDKLEAELQKGAPRDPGGPPRP